MGFDEVDLVIFLIYFDLQSEEEKMVIENKAREAERIVSQLVDEAERRKEEARELQREVATAR